MFIAKNEERTNSFFFYKNVHKLSESLTHANSFAVPESEKLIKPRLWVNSKWKMDVNIVHNILDARLHYKSIDEDDLDDCLLLPFTIQIVLYLFTNGWKRMDEIPFLDNFCPLSMIFYILYVPKLLYAWNILTKMYDCSVNDRYTKLLNYPEHFTLWDVWSNFDSHVLVFKARTTLNSTEDILPTIFFFFNLLI